MSNSNVFNQDQAGQLPDNPLLPNDEYTGWAAGDDNCIMALHDLLKQAEALTGPTDEVEDSVEELIEIAEDILVLAIQMHTDRVEAAARSILDDLRELAEELYEDEAYVLVESENEYE